VCAREGKSTSIVADSFVFASLCCLHIHIHTRYAFCICILKQKVNKKTTLYVCVIVVVVARVRERVCVCVCVCVLQFCYLSGWGRRSITNRHHVWTYCSDV